MNLAPHQHFRKTASLAKALDRKSIYQWLVTKGYFPEPYVLPPCFEVTAHPRYGKLYFAHTKRQFNPRVTEYQQVNFPKTDYTDRTFGVIDPELHSDIACTIARNWKTIVGSIFHKSNKVCCYSFPIPLDSNAPGSIGSLRAGRMIYEFIEMAENDIAGIAYRFNCLIKTDIKNFYPSVYTHSIPWALHGKKFIRRPANRRSYTFFGNRLDKLFQYVNDECTNGIPIGPAVSDLAAEIILSGVDRRLSSKLKDDVVVLRFKDDYRILGKTAADAVSVIKELQSALKEYRLELNDEKTQVYTVPSGIFREWVSQYHAANPNPKKYYSFHRFKETCLSVIKIDRSNSGCGVIDRFLNDIITKTHELRVRLDKKTLPKVLSLLLMIGGLHAKAFPKVLAIIEAILKSPLGAKDKNSIGEYLSNHLTMLSEKESENRYLIAWVCYFLRSNGLENLIRRKHKFRDPIVRATYTSRFTLFKSCKDFKVFLGVKKAGTKISLLRHLDVFNPQ